MMAGGGGVGMEGAGGDGDPYYSRPEVSGSGPWVTVLSVQQLRSPASMDRSGIMAGWQLGRHFLGPDDTSSI